MVKVYEIEYVVDTKNKIKAKKDEIIDTHGRLWEHAVNEPVFKYSIKQGDIEKAKAVSNLMKILVNRSGLVKKKQVVKEVV